MLLLLLRHPPPRPRVFLPLCRVFPHKNFLTLVYTLLFLPTSLSLSLLLFPSLPPFPALSFLLSLSLSYSLSPSPSPLLSLSLSLFLFPLPLSLTLSTKASLVPLLPRTHLRSLSSPPHCRTTCPLNSYSPLFFLSGLPLSFFPSARYTLYSYPPLGLLLIHSSIYTPLFFTLSEALTDSAEGFCEVAWSLIAIGLLHTPRSPSTLALLINRRSNRNGSNINILHLYIFLTPVIAFAIIASIYCTSSSPTPTTIITHVFS